MLVNEDDIVGTNRGKIEASRCSLMQLSASLEEEMKGVDNLYIVVRLNIYLIGWLWLTPVA
jgi:hypothetical protein